jgi:hypothetical protein
MDSPFLPSSRNVSYKYYLTPPPGKEKHRGTHIKTGPFVRAERRKGKTADSTKGGERKTGLKE